MNIKNIAIALTVLVIAFLATVLMQKGNYVSQATERYTKTTEGLFKATNANMNFISGSIDTYKMVWALACEGIQSAKSSQDMAKLESKYVPAVKGSNSKAQMTRRFEATPNYFIVSNFSKVETDKKTDIWYLSGLTSIDVSALLRKTVAEEPVEEFEEGEE